jgi:predicted nucleotidyltransferase
VVSADPSETVLSATGENELEKGTLLYAGRIRKLRRYLRNMRTSSLINSLMPKSRQGVLAATLLQPHRSWYLADLARHLGVRSSTLQREVASLTSVGILKSHRRGRMVYFEADTECPVYPDLRGLLLKTSGLVDVLRSAMAAVVQHIRVAFVYGSIARSHERSESDVDLMIIGDVDLSQIASSTREATHLLGREVKPKIYRPIKFTQRLARNDHFLQFVLKSPKIFIYGTERDLGQTSR